MTWDPEGSVLTLGALGSVHLLGNGVDTPFEVSAFAGYGWSDRYDYTESGVPGDWRIPLGGSVLVALTTPIGSIRPWLAPRADIFPASTPDGVTTKARLAGSVGIDVRFPGGPGLLVMWDQVDGYDSTLGVGLSYRF
jgi:hypothetical protein